MASSNSGSVSQPVVFSRLGSVFANHLVQSMLITAKEPKESKEEGRSTEVRDDGLIKIEQDDEGIEVSESMDALTNQILSECQLKFGDEWTECEFSFPKQFIDAPLRKDTYSSMEARFVSTTSKSHSDIVALVKEKAIRHMSSRPGRDESGGNTRCHSLCKQSIQGILEPDRLLILNDMLNYRNHQLEIAGRYAVKLGSSKDGIPDQFDQVEWHSSLNKDRI
ncbi:uncharacterized protein RAG0_06323 [Rhynchosporium agropyri]|uniref:Uncharacterized protein n=1 Tax=Rhynchosporium agropyri TaxID=914238 RepID=A0A1E1KGJ2_9HELO|nr:uncharacterized protein RAG0_06323 [Rhynchosporium agropyri]